MLWNVAGFVIVMLNICICVFICMLSWLSPYICSLYRYDPISNTAKLATV